MSGVRSSCTCNPSTPALVPDLYRNENQHAREHDLQNISVVLIGLAHIARRRYKDALLLFAFTAAALLIHGYHPAAEDAAIYLPAIKRILNPALYPVGSEFFLSQTGLTCFTELIAWSVRFSHVGLGYMLLVWQLLSTFLLLMACLLLCEAVIPRRSYRWTAVAVVTAVLTIPIAGTSLLMTDSYLTPRSLSTPLVVFALVATLRKHYWIAGACLLAIFPIHPLMTVYGAAFCAALLLVREPVFSSKHGARLWIFLALAVLLSLTFFLARTLLSSVSPAYHQALLTRSYLFLKNWAWYEWMGIIAPLVLIYLLFRAAEKKNLSSLAALCRAALLFGVVSLAFGILFSTSPRFESVAEIQPMRAFHSIYVVFFVLLGAVLGRSIVRSSLARRLLVLAPVCLCMFLVQRATFPASRHIQWPWVQHRNGWLRAFVWIRENTPTSAVFALSPDHMNASGEDNEGFRAVAERSMLADQCKDPGVVTVFPGLAKTWDQEVSSRQGWDRFDVSDFQKLSRLYGVSWVVLQKPVANLICPYQNESVLVCKVPADHLPAEPTLIPVACPNTEVTIHARMIRSELSERCNPVLRAGSF